MTLVFAASAGQPAVGSGGKMRMRRVGMKESPHQQKDLLTIHPAAPPAPFRGCQSFVVFAWLVLCLACWWWVVGGGWWANNAESRKRSRQQQQQQRAPGGGGRLALGSFCNGSSESNQEKGEGGNNNKPPQ